MKNLKPGAMLFVSLVAIFAIGLAAIPRTGASASAQGVPTGQVFDWGNPSKGGPVCSGADCYASPKAVEGLPSVVAIDAENTFNLYLGADGTVWANGKNSGGQLGDGTTTASDSTPVQVLNLSNVVQTAGGDNDAIALESNGTVWTWGYNKYGQLGDGNNTNSDTPQQVPGLSGVIAVDAGGNHDYALMSDGTVMAWGQGDVGQLGDGKTGNSNVPVQVKGLTGVQSISSGNTFGAALMPNGTVKMWGYNAYGQLCDGTTTNALKPELVPGLSGVEQVSAGGNEVSNGHVMFLMDDGTVQTCGYNGFGELGDGTTTNSSTPVQVQGLSDVSYVAAGGAHSMALTASGALYTWGDNLNGQLGDGTTNNSLLPENVLNGVGWISAGSMHSLAALTPSS